MKKYAVKYDGFFAKSQGGSQLMSSGPRLADIIPRLRCDVKRAKALFFIFTAVHAKRDACRNITFKVKEDKIMNINFEEFVAIKNISVNTKEEILHAYREYEEFEEKLWITEASLKYNVEEVKENRDTVKYYFLNEEDQRDGLWIKVEYTVSGWGWSRIFNCRGELETWSNSIAIEHLDPWSEIYIGNDGTICVPDIAEKTFINETRADEKSRKEALMPGYNHGWDDATVKKLENEIERKEEKAWCKAENRKWVIIGKAITNYYSTYGGDVLRLKGKRVNKSDALAFSKTELMESIEETFHESTIENMRVTELYLLEAIYDVFSEDKLPQVISRFQTYFNCGPCRIAIRS